MFFENGRLIIQSTPGNFRCNMYEISTSNMDQAFDDQVATTMIVSQAGQQIDPKTCLLLPLRVRKDFRDHEKQLKHHLEKLGKTLGTPVAFEFDVVSMYAEEKLSKDYKLKLGSNLYDGYVRDICGMLENFIKGDDDNRAALLMALSARAFVVRFGDKKEECNAKYVT